MPLFKKKPVQIITLPPAPEPTLEERLASANIAATTHLSAFVRAADGLEKAADDFDALGSEYAAVEELAGQQKVTADLAAAQHRAQATKIRDLLS